MMLEQLMKQMPTSEANGRNERETLLLLTGVIGIILGFACLIVMLVHGNRVPPDGEWMKPVTFNLAVGLFVVTTAFILPQAGFGQRGRTVFRRLLACTMIYWYGMETIQTYRGVDPRFGDGSFLKDELPGILFGISSVWVIVLYAMLIGKYFSGKILRERPVFVLGIRYGLATVLLGFAAGIWMVTLEGRTSGAAGSILAIHFLGFHAFQAIPLIGWLLERSRLDRTRIRLMLHTAGCSWIIAVLCSAQQAYLGVSPVQPTLFSVLEFMCLLLCFSVMLYGVLVYRKAVGGERLLSPGHS